MEKYPIKKSHIICVRRKKIDRLPGDDAVYTAKIGSSLRHGVQNRGLDAEEERKYLPTLIGSDPLKSDWAVATENYWKNISVNVPDTEMGLQLEVGFMFPTQEDADQYKNGVPINIPDYVLHRYCLVYRKVANSIEDVDKSPQIVFYLHDINKDLKQKVDVTKQKQKAYAEYLKIVDDEDTVNLVLLVLEVNKLGIKMEKDDKMIALQSIIEDRPFDFLKVVLDEDLKIKAFIKRCLSKKLLTNIPNTSIYSKGDDVIANSLEQLIALFKSPEGEPIVTHLKANLKNLK